MAPSKSPQQIKPKPLNVGDTIGLISPAGITGEDEDYDKVIQTIRQMAYKVKEGKHARKKHGYLAVRMINVLKILILCLLILP